jgi:hypothetical protein
MNAIWIKAGLQEIKKNFESVLEDDAGWIIDEAIAELDSSKEEFERRQGKTHDLTRLRPEPWGYRIYPDSPLRFRPSRVIRGVNLWVDLYCTVLWKEEGALPIKQDIHLRVWSDEIDYIYRSDWDSEIVYDRLTEGRVMLRCHFDLANPGQPGPEYHLQFGGNSWGNELCWFPESMNLPRLPYPPMDLVLVCQLIAANFYWDEYVGFRETSEWKNALRRSHEYLLKDYYEGCLGALDQDLLVDHLWNPSYVRE